VAEPKTDVKSPLLPKHGAFYVGLLCGSVAFLLALVVTPRFAFAIGVNVLFAVYLGLTSLKFGRLTPQILRRHADESDLPAWIILGVVIIAVGLSIYELFRALNGGGTPAIDGVLVGLVSVVLGWFTIHTMVALHYAFEFYESPKVTPAKGSA